MPDIDSHHSALDSALEALEAAVIGALTDPGLSFEEKRGFYYRAFEVVHDYLGSACATVGFDPEHKDE